MQNTEYTIDRTCCTLYKKFNASKSDKWEKKATHDRSSIDKVESKDPLFTAAEERVNESPMADNVLDSTALKPVALFEPRRDPTLLTPSLKELDFEEEKFKSSEEPILNTCFFENLIFTYYWIIYFNIIYSS